MASVNRSWFPSLPVQQSNQWCRDASKRDVSIYHGCSMDWHLYLTMTLFVWGPRVACICWWWKESFANTTTHQIIIPNACLISKMETKDTCAAAWSGIPPTACRDRCGTNTAKDLGISLKDQIVLQACFCFIKVLAKKMKSGWTVRSLEFAATEGLLANKERNYCPKEVVLVLRDFAFSKNSWKSKARFLYEKLIVEWKCFVVKKYSEQRWS